MMEKGSAHARPEQQMGEVMRVTSTVRIIPKSLQLNPSKDNGDVGMTGSDARARAHAQSENL